MSDRRVWDRLHEISESSDEESLDYENVHAERGKEEEEEEEEEERSMHNDESHVGSELSIQGEELSLEGDLDETILDDTELELASLFGIDQSQMPSFEGLLD